jgi:hypothetical protein
LFEGEYTINIEDGSIDGIIHVTVAPNETTITGFSTGQELLNYDVPIKLPIKIDDDDVFRLETPVGPVNAKSRKLRSLPGSYNDV